MGSRPRSRSYWRRVATVLVIAGVGYGALLALSAARASDRERVADLAELAALGVRPVGAPGRHLAERLGTALDAVAGARNAPLTGSPTYDAARLDAAASSLARLVDEAESQTAVSQEARLALGRVRLHQGRDAEAARVLGTLVRQGGYRAPEARRLIDFVRATESRAPGADPDGAP